MNNIESLELMKTAIGTKSATVVFKNGKVVKCDVSTPEKQKDFEKNYGITLPPLPPQAEKIVVSTAPTKIVKDEDVKVTEVFIEKEK